MSQHVRLSKPKFHYARKAARFTVGRDLSGAYKTNHGWGKQGTRTVSPEIRATRWDYLPLRRRAGIRLLTLGAIIAVPIGFIVSAGSTWQTLRVIVWMLLLIGAWAIVEKSRKYMYKREILIPTAEVVSYHLKDSRYTLDPKTWLSIPYDVLDGPSTVYLDNSHQLDDAKERALAKAVGRKLGLVQPTVAFQYSGERAYMELRAAPLPPQLVKFSDPEVRILVDKAKEGGAFIGLGPRNTPCFLDFNTQSPHIGLSMATNSGKSTAARPIIMRTLHDGGIALILDPKMDSHLWARDLPNVRYADTAEEIHKALLWLSGEMDRRSEVAKAHADIRGDVDPELIGPRLLVVCEEINTLEIDLSAYWRTIRKPGEPIKPSSLSALGRTLNMGRARRINALLIAQELLVQSIGGPAAKTNLSTRILGRANTPTWNKLAPECKVNGKYPRWKRTDPRGRVYVVTGDEPLSVQIMLTDEQDAIDYSLSGIVTPFPGEAGHEAGPANPQDEAGEAAHPESLSIVKYEPAAVPASLPHEENATEETITLSDAAERLAITLKTLRNARDRDPQFPEPATVERGKPSTYHFIELEKWAITRAYGTGWGAS